MTAELVEELGYVAGLLRTEGDENVPRELVATYLELQYRKALREHEDAIAGVFFEARQRVSREKWVEAREAIVAEIARLR